MRTIAVIGHGKTPVGRRWGKRIDACDIVLRMWDWHWQDETDYGRKYSIGFFEVAPTLMQSFYQHNKHEPIIGWVGSALWQPQLCQLPPRTELINQDSWVQIGRNLGGLGKTGRLAYTRGTIAACWAIEYASNGDKVVLVGFDNVRKGKTLSVQDGFPNAYVSQPSTFTFNGYQTNVRKYGNHDFGIELPVMCHLAEQRGVELAFADDEWK